MFRTTTMLIVGLVGAAIFAQAPEFSQQYRQRLGGAVEELRTVVERFDADAARLGLSRGQAMQRYQASPDRFLQSRGDSMGEHLARYDAIAMQEQQLQASGVLTRPFLVARSPDETIVNATWQSYRPAVPTTPEGGVYGVAGFFAARMVWGVLLSLFGLGRRRRRA